MKYLLLLHSLSRFGHVSVQKNATSWTDLTFIITTKKLNKMYTYTLVKDQ